MDKNYSTSNYKAFLRQNTGFLAHYHSILGFYVIYRCKAKLDNWASTLCKASDFELMIEELDRANSIITEILSLSRNKPIALSVQSLNTIITKLLPLLQADALRNEQNIMVKLEKTPNIEMNEPEVRQVILNLARNGFEAMSAGGVLMINVYPENDQVVMIFRDQGSGIPPEVLEDIGKPFLTTKDKGTGLGLTVSYKIVHRHAGTISIETGPEVTTFKVKLPISRSTCLG